MDQKQISTVLLVLSIIYGALVGVLSVTESSALKIVAIIGGAVLGIGWATVGALFTRDRNH